MKIKNLFFFLILILLFLVNYSFAGTQFVKYKLSTFEDYASQVYLSKKFQPGCSILDFGVVLDDQYEISKFSDNILDGTKKVYYEGTKKLFSLQLNVAVGTTNNISFTVTNTNQETSNINVQLSKPFECKKFLTPFNITTIGDLYLYQGMLYGFNIGLNVSNDINLSQVIKCTISFAQYCGVFKWTNSYFIYGSSLIMNEMNKEKFTVVLSDQFGGSQTLMIDNTIFSYSTKPSVIKSIVATPANNSDTVMDSYNSFIKFSLQVTYSGELNAYPVVKDERTGQLIQDMGSLILGTPEEQTMLFSSFAYGPQQPYTLYDVAANIEKVTTLNYSIGTPSGSSDLVVTSPSLSLVQSTETGNLILTAYFQLSRLDPTLEIYPAYFPQNFTSTIIPSYPYGISKSNRNSYYELNTEGMFANSLYGAGYQYGIGGYSFLGTVGTGYQNGPSFPIPTNTPNLITSDTEGPILRHISYQLLENSRLLVTMNITDVGSGVYFIFCIQPYFSLLAKQALISGDLNNGIYQFLVSVEDVQVNQLQMSVYDYMGNYGLNNDVYTYTDLDFTSVSPILDINLTPNDITFFEFDRLEIDTSFDDLEVNLRINFTGATATGGAIPKLVPIYGDSRSTIEQFKGVFNETSQMFDVKINVKARERGYFQYLLFISPLFIFETDIEALFPGQQIKLTTNYVDHFPPIITNLTSLTNVNLTINQGDEIEIGWNVEIYDYPTGLDYAYFEVVSDKDYEPYKFTFKPDTSIPGSDILSTYTIKLPIKPVVGQTYYISKVNLFDKNGYTSQYPADSTGFGLHQFASFFNNSFTSERNIKVSLSSSSLPVNDNTAPVLKSLTLPTSFDSFGINRTAVFEFTIQDDLSGISTRHNPYVYVQFLYQGYVSVQSQLVNSNSLTLTNTYRAVFNFDYAVLAYGAIVSINGITDNSMNILSYSSTQLKSNGFPSTITNPIQTRPPVILEHTKLNENGGKLFIYGKEFTDSPIVYMDKGNGFEIISSSFSSNAAITLVIPSVKGIESIKFKVVSKQLDSNIITINPIVNPITSDNSNCSTLNDCNGKGQCINSKCVCVSGASGPDCSSTTNEINVKPNETPSLNSFGSMIELNQLDEIDYSGNVIKSYPLTSWESSTIQSQYQSGDAYQYKTTLSETGTTVTIVVDIFNSPTTVNFASKTLSMDKGTVKYTISFSSYLFGSRLNTLQLKVNASIQVNNSTCKLNSYSLTPGTNSLEWVKLRSNDQSIYGKFIQNALVDYRSVSIQNKLLVEPTIDNQQAIVGIQIPYFYQNAVLDPDFSVLLDSDNLGENKKSSCYSSGNGSGNGSDNGTDGNNTNGNNSSGLPKSKVIIISTICGVIGAALIFTTVLLIKKKSALLKFKKSMKATTN